MNGPTDLVTAIDAIRRRWWLVVALPIAVLTASLIMTSNRPYLATVRATILIPGDTEIPGNAERPELMVLDDAPALVGSQVFAEAVEDRLRSVAPGFGLSVDEVRSALSAHRYSRILTIEARHDREQEARAIAVGAAAALPGAVNQFLVAPNADPATVQIIDPPRQAMRDNHNRLLIVTIQTAVALVVGIGVALLAASLDDRLFSSSQIETVLGLPILSDLRSSPAAAKQMQGRRWLRRG